MALRLRGAKTELEEAGLETENMAESTSTLQAKLLALTHGKVDIMKDAETFKNTTQILREMSEAWEDMTDIERASALELMGGKRQANILSSVITNFETVESVIETSMNSAGSAMAENEKYMDSIQGKTDILKNSMETMWSNTLSSDFAKGLLDIANAFIKITDSVGLLNVAFAALAVKSAVGKNGLLGDIINGVTSGQSIGQAIGAITSEMNLAGMATKFLTGSLTALASVAIGWAIGKIVEGIDNYIHRAEILKEEVNELKRTSEDAQKTFKSNMETLTKSSDTEQFATLQDEFNMLARGVDKYGNNISLTTDQYERYKQICEQIVGISPRIALGYDSATEAIGNNANVLSDLIELQKEQARLESQKYVSDENLEKFAKDAKNDYLNAKIDSAKKITSKRDELFGMLDQGSTKETMEHILRTIGYNEADISRKISEYFMHDVGGYDTTLFMGHFIDEINKNASKFDVKNLDKFFVEYENTIKSGEQSVKEAQDELIETLLVVPKIDEDYDKLSNSSKNFLSEWIKNSDMFKVDDTTTPEKVQAMRDAVFNMLDILTSDVKNIEYDGKQISAKDVVDKIFNFDPTGISWQDYKTQISTLINKVWDAIGGDSNVFGLTKKQLTEDVFGFDFTQVDFDIANISKQILGHIDMTAEEIQAMLDGMDAKQIQAYYSINWNEVDWDNVNGPQDILKLVDNKVAAMNGVKFVQTYATISASVSNLNDVEKETNSEIRNGVQVTQEYKDALLELGITSEDLNECFDENNELVVRSAAGIRNLVKQAKANTAENIKLARSQARLRYHELTGELNNVVGSSNNLSGSSMTLANSILDQMDAVQLAIYKYSLLEQSLLGAGNAFQGFEDAKEIDAMNTYANSYVEMAQTMYDAIYKTGKTGSETFWASVETLIPDNVYTGYEDHIDKIAAIRKYYEDNVLNTLTNDKGSLSFEFKISPRRLWGMRGLCPLSPRVEEFIQ